MKNTSKTLLISFLMSVTLFSCKKDKNENPEKTSILTYNSINYNLAEGVIIDYGADSFYGTSNTHINYDFYITDGKIEYDAAGDLSDIKGRIAIFAELYSAGTTGGFKIGTFNFIDDSNDASLTPAQTRTKYENKSFFTDGALLVGTDNVNSSLENATQIDIKSGSVTVTGTNNNYSVDFDLVLTNNKAVKGSYNKNFKLVVD
jgi:hypothetical protein